MAPKFCTMFPDSCNPLEKIYNHTQRGTTKANSALKMESQKCHPTALKLPGCLCLSTLVAHKTTLAERVAFGGQLSAEAPLGEKNIQTHAHEAMCCGKHTHT